MDSPESEEEGRFVDYFAVCGLDPLDGVEPNELTVDSTENLHPLHRGYKSKVLAHYPETVEWNPFDNVGVNMLCMPKGLTFSTQHQDRKPKFHSFVITREDRTQVYGAALTFFELVTDEKLCTQFNMLQGKFSEENTLRKVSTGDIPQGVVLESVSPRMGRRFSPRHRRSSSPSIQGLNSPRFRRRGSPAHQGWNMQKANTLPRTKSAVRHYDIMKDALFVSKCICLILKIPLVRSCQQFLEQLFEIIRTRNPETLPIESYIYNILYEVSLPQPGKSMEFFGPVGRIACQRPSLWELPLCEYSMREMFELLGPENVLELLTCAFLEKQILLLSKDYNRLMLVAECLTALLFPFLWQHVYVPIVPASMLHFLDAPFSFIMGLHLDELFEEEFEVPNQASMCYIDIDTQTAEFPEDLPLFPQREYLLHELVELMHLFGVQITDMDTNSNTLPNPPRTGNIFDWGKGGRHEQTLVGSPGRGYSLESSLEGDQDSSYSSSPSGGESPIPMIPSKLDFLTNNEVVSKVAAIAKRTGVIQSISDINVGPRENETTSPENKANKEYVDDIVFNCAIRETLLSHLVSLLRHYERFVIHPKERNLEAWFTNREHMHNYDKASFLSDQPEAYLPFLSSFLESQMFATFIDNKIISGFEEKDQALEIFDGRIRECPSSAPQTPTDGGCMYINEAEDMIYSRARNINYAPPEPHKLPLLTPSTCHIPGFFPKLDATLLEKQPFTDWRTRQCEVNHSEKNKRYQQQEESFRNIREEKMLYIKQARNSVKSSLLSNYDMNQANLSFVEELLKECKVKTKKMLVFKMGQEAVELGHGDVNRSGVEENTLIASLCDFLERIFSHRIHRKQSANFQGKSALWSFLIAYRRFRTKKQSSSEQNLYSLDRPVHTAQRRSSVVSDQLLQPLPSDIMYDMRNVERMSDIKTDVGRARAFVRLSLERKLLHNHLRELVSTQELCKRRYKRYAFLRAEEEKEQFLYYLLSLNAVDHTCFTNSFISTTMSYRVLIIQSRKFQAPLTANPWICVSGEINTTKLIPIPKNNQGFIFSHQNLGMLTTVRIGHDNAGFLPRWLVDNVVIRNEITGHTYKFPCGKWIGKGVDDGSLERLLVGELLPLCQDLEHDFGRGSQTLPNRKKSSTLPRPSHTSIKLDQSAIQEKLTDVVNNIVKHFYKSDKERGSFTPLLCGEDGLVHCMEMVLQYGFKSSRLFQKNFYIWDFLEKVKRCLDMLDESEEGHLSSQQEKKARKTFCFTLEQITQHGRTMGKDGKFQMLPKVTSSTDVHIDSLSDCNSNRQSLTSPPVSPLDAKAEPMSPSSPQFESPTFQPVKTPSISSPVSNPSSLTFQNLAHSQEQKRVEEMTMSPPASAGSLHLRSPPPSVASTVGDGSNTAMDMVDLSDYCGHDVQASSQLLKQQQQKIEELQRALELSQMQLIQQQYVSNGMYNPPPPPPPPPPPAQTSTMTSRMHTSPPESGDYQQFFPDLKLSSPPHPKANSFQGQDFAHTINQHPKVFSFASPPANGQPFQFTKGQTNLRAVHSANGIITPKSASMPSSPTEEAILELGSGLARSITNPNFIAPPPNYEEAVRQTIERKVQMMGSPPPAHPQTSMDNTSRSPVNNLSFDDLFEVLVGHGYPAATSSGNQKDTGHMVQTSSAIKSPSSITSSAAFSTASTASIQRSLPDLSASPGPMDVDTSDLSVFTHVMSDHKAKNRYSIPSMQIDSTDPENNLLSLTLESGSPAENAFPGALSVDNELNWLDLVLPSTSSSTGGHNMGHGQDGSGPGSFAKDPFPLNLSDLTDINSAAEFHQLDGDVWDNIQVTD